MILPDGVSSEPCSTPRRRLTVAHHVAHVVLGRHDLDLHDRLEQHRIGLVEAFLEAHRAGDLERHFVRVDFVVRAVDQLDLDVDDRDSPPSDPLVIASRMPLSTAGMYSFGTTPPTISFSNS